MHWKTFRQIVGSSMSVTRAKQLTPGLNQALIEAKCDSTEKVAMFIAQTCEESARYQASEEYASGEEYEGRRDLGNTHPGDGIRYKGRSFIQITGRNNYGAISRWAHKHGIVPTDNYFVEHPRALAYDKYVWLGPVFYWQGNHNHGYSGPFSINTAAARRDLIAATEMVNGGLNGLDTRRFYWERALAKGSAILPDKKVGMFKGLKIMRAIVLGGKYATKELKHDHPSLIDGKGVKEHLHNHHVELTDFKHKLAELDKKLEALERKS